MRNAGAETSTVPFDELAKFLGAMVGGDLVVDERSIQFEGRFGPSRIEANYVGVQATDGEVIEDIVTVYTDIPNELADYLDPAKRPMANTMASLGALVIDSADGRLKVASRVSSFANRNEMWGLYLPLVAYASLIQAESIIGGVSYALGHDVKLLPIPGADEGSRWSADEFESVVNVLTENGVFASSGSNILTAEFPIGVCFLHAEYFVSKRAGADSVCLDAQSS